MQARDLAITDIRVGNHAHFEHVFLEKDVQLFSELSGDTNPLHMDEVYATTTSFGKRIVHGMLVASLCSRMVGMYIPGKRCLYLHQTLAFKKPVFIGDILEVTGTVIAKSDATKVLAIGICIKKADTIVLEGEARVQVM